MKMPGSVLGKLFSRRVPDDVAKPEAQAFHPLDHDQDGRPGGSVSHEPSEDLTALRAKYRKTVGKQAWHGWDAETLRQKIADH